MATDTIARRQSIGGEEAHCPYCNGGTLPEEQDCEICENRRWFPVNIIQDMNKDCVACPCDTCIPDEHA